MNDAWDGKLIMPTEQQRRMTNTNMSGPTKYVVDIAIQPTRQSHPPNVVGVCAGNCVGAFISCGDRSLNAASASTRIF